MPAMPAVNTATLVNANLERISFEWDDGTSLPVTVKCYDPLGDLDQKTNLPREQARLFWTEMLAIGFYLNV